MKDMATKICVVITLAILALCYAPAAQEETVNVDIDIERIIEEAKEGGGKKIVIIRKEERTQKAPEPLGMNLTLEFTLEGSGRSFSVTTATTNFMLSSQQSSKVSERIMYKALSEEEHDEEYDEGEFEDEEEYDDEESEEEYDAAIAESYSTTETMVNLDGSIELMEDGTLLIRCGGAFMHESQTSEELEEAAEDSNTSSILNFATSAMMRPGETKTLVTQGPLRLVLHIATD